MMSNKPICRDSVQRIQKSLTQKVKFALVLIAAFFTKAKLWKQSKYAVINNKHEAHLHNGIQFNYEKGEGMPFGSKMEELHAKWKKS